MNYLLTIKTLYLANGFIAVLLYLPQIVKACKSREDSLSLSLVTFGGWSIGSVITALYASLLVQDRMFTMVSLGNLFGSGAVFALVAFRRLASKSK